MAFTPSGATVHLQSKGEYMCVPVHVYDDFLYAEHAPKKFIRLSTGGHTSSPKFKWSALSIKHSVDELGYITAHKGR